MSDTPHIMADHGIIPAETLDPIEATRATEGQFGHPADTRQLRTSNEPAASALSRIPNATGQGQDSGELAGLAMGGLIEREAAAQIAERDCDWSAFGKSGIPEWDGGPDGIRDYRLGIRVGRAIAAAQTAPRVKALAWRPYGYHGQGMEASACGLETFYRIDGRPGDWTLTSPGRRTYVHTSGYATRADAQAAATVDFERRMTAHMDPTAPDWTEVAMAECQALSAGYEAGEKATAGGEELAKLRTEVERLRKALGDEQDCADEMADVLSECGDGLMFDVDRLQAALDQHDALREAALRAEQGGEA